MSGVAKREEKFLKDCELMNNCFTSLHLETKEYCLECSIDSKCFTFNVDIRLQENWHHFRVYGCEDYPEHDLEQQVEGQNADSDTDDNSEYENDEDQDMGGPNFWEEDENIYGLCGSKVLRAEISECQSVYGENSVAVSSYAGLDMCDIYILIDTAGLESTTSQAWGFLKDEPLVVKLEDVPFSEGCYRKSQIKPEVKVYYQVQPEMVFAAGKQLERIIQQYLTDHWLLTGSTGSNASQENVIMAIRCEALRRLQTLSEYCIICDGKHQLPMMMPSICQRNLCVFAFETLGLMADVGSIGTQLEVVVLLQTMLNEAAFSDRYDLILDPFPKVVNPSDPNEMVLDPGRKDIKLLRNVLSKLPCPQQLSASLEWTECVKKCGDELAWRVVRWVISSNRTFLVKLDEKLLDFMVTKHQFLMLTDTPAKEKSFNEAKEKHGSLFLFHGSPMENWHSILRKGLIAASGTKYQMNGAVHGSGIYLSPNVGMSFGYSLGTNRSGTMPSGRVNSSDYNYRVQDHMSHDCSDNGKFIDVKNKCVCIAICEVIDSTALKKGSNDIWVLTNPGYCCTRFLFVYDSVNLSSEGSFRKMMTKSIKTVDTEYGKRLRDVMNNYMSQSRNSAPDTAADKESYCSWN